MAFEMAVQCPGCWSVNVAKVPEGGSLECECGEKLTVIDLRDGDNPLTVDRGSLVFDKPQPSREGGAYRSAQGLLDEALKLIDKQRDYDALAKTINERVLRTPEPTPKQATLMEEFEDEMPVWAQLSFVQSENERMREELRQALSLRDVPDRPTADDLALPPPEATLTDEEREREFALAAFPFAQFARNNVDENGWKEGSCGRERIVDWFGPSDFRLLLDTLAGKEQR